ncbi:unnamed protein product [Closterium sp. NIES-53]
MVVGRLLHEESRCRQFTNESEGAAMFSGGSSGKKSTWSKGATKKSSGGSDRGKGNTSNGSSKCHYCGKAGHFWHECRKRPSNWTPSKARNHKGNAHTASGDADDSRESIVLLANDGTNTPSDAWFLNTGATQHMTHSASFLTNVGAPGEVTSVVFRNDKSLPVVGVGSTRLIVDGGPVDITNVLLILGLNVNLLSVTQLMKKGVKVTIDDAKMNLFWKGKQFAQGVLNGELYQLKTHPRVASSNIAQCSKAILKVWHNRLAHANYDSVKELANKRLAKGFGVTVGDNEKGVCVACVEGKMARKPFGSRTSPLSKDPLALVHMDMCGPMRHASKGGARFLLVMLDDATRMCWTRLLKAKGDVTKAIQEWALEVCGDDKKRIKAIRTDGGGEFVNAEFEKWMKSKGIKHDVTTPYTPQHNGAAERLNRTLVEAVRSLLQHSKLGSEWWGVNPRKTQGIAESEGASSGGAEPKGEEPGGAEPVGVEPGGAESECAESEGAEPKGAASSGGPAGASPRLSPQQLLTAGAGGTGGTAATGPGGARTRGTGATGTGGVGGAGDGDPTEPGSAGVGGSGAGGAGAGGARAGGTGAGGAGAGGDGVGGTGAGGAGAGGTDAGGVGAGGTGAGGAGAGGAGAVDLGGTMRPRPYFVPLLQQVLRVTSSTSLTPPLLCPPPDQSQLPLQPASPLPAPSPYTEQFGGLTERREPASHPVLPIRTARRVPRSRPPHVPSTHAMALRPSSVPLCVPLPAPPESSLSAVSDPESDRARATSPTVSRLLATAVTDPSFQSGVASALIVELLDFATACRLDDATALVVESASASPPSIGGECALGTDVLEDM